MNIRSKTYSLLLPSALSLGILYLVILLIFNRRDAYSSLEEQVRNRADIIHTFITANHPQSPDEIIKFLTRSFTDHNKSLVSLKQDLTLKLTSKGSNETTFFWSNKWAEDQLEKRHLYIEERVINLEAGNDPVVLEVISSHPGKVYLDKSFWLQILKFTIFLAILGIILSEALIYILKRDIGSLKRSIQRSGKHPKTHLNHNIMIQELTELDNVYDILRDTYESNVIQREYLKGNPTIFPKQSDYNNWKRTNRKRSSIILKNLRVHLFSNHEKNPQKIVFLHTDKIKAYAFVGDLRTNQKDFDINISEKIIHDFFNNKSTDSLFDSCCAQLQQMNLFHKIVLIEICAESDRLKTAIITDELIGYDNESMIDQKRSVFPIGFTIPENIKKQFIHSSKWMKLFSAFYSNNTILFIEPQ